MNNILLKEFNLSEFNEKEILRYLGLKEWDGQTKKIFDECVEELKLSYKVCYLKTPIEIKEYVIMGNLKIKSKDLAKNLKGCNEVILFAATIGVSIDFLISKYGKISPVKGLMFQAIGTERIESLCDEFCKFLNLGLRPRFSPGYGDFSLECQKEIFKMLDCPRKIGLTLNESLLMLPSKSVTAIMGISDECYKRGTCEDCSKTDCTFRRID